MNRKEKILDLLAQARELAEDIMIDGEDYNGDTAGAFEEVWDAIDHAGSVVGYYADDEDEENG